MKFTQVAGPYRGRTGGMVWDGRRLLFSAVLEDASSKHVNLPRESSRVVVDGPGEGSDGAVVVSQCEFRSGEVESHVGAELRVAV